MARQIIIACFLLAACQTNDSLRVSVSSIQHLTPECSPEADPCFMANISYPVFEGNASDQVNKMVNNTLLDAMGLGDVESTDLVDFSTQFTALDSQLKRLAAETGFRQGWTMQSEVTHQFENDTILSVGLEVMTYFGGAHPNTNTIYFNVDRRSAKRISYRWLEAQNLNAQIEDAFRQHYGLKPSDSLNKTGTWFQNNTIQLPANFGFTSTGLLIHYNRYEKAPYAMGPISFEVNLH